MKNKKRNSLLKKTLGNFLIQVVLVSLIVPLVFFLIMLFISTSDFQWVYDEYPNLYWFFVEIYHIFFQGIRSVIFLVVLWIAIIIYRLYKMLEQIFSSMQAVFDSLDCLFDEDSEYITLPEEWSEVESKLNYFKIQAARDKRLARENEQKKDELIVYLAHDIKTPLTSMIGYLSILEETPDIPLPERKKYTSIVLEKSYKLEDLINELFEIARFNSEKITLMKEKLNLNLMLEQIIDDFYPILKEFNKKIDLEIEEKIEIMADSDKLGRVFNNLIKNAIHYSKKEGKIQIIVKRQENSIAVDVMNEGREIPPEKLKRIFEKFYRLDAARTSKTGGSGLGLAIAKEIVELHGGKIWAESNFSWMIFHVTLPIDDK